MDQVNGIFTGNLSAGFPKYGGAFRLVGSLAAGMLPRGADLLVGPASVPVIRAVATFHGVTGRDAGPTGSRLGVSDMLCRQSRVIRDRIYAMKH
ncbi:MAG: hypothetical protein FJY85_01605 [Deltaproteobacteria bacterium]|nr:hypothetical protein [Deltaproteobacteria bacterium]